MRCEIYPGQPHRLTMIDATGAEQTEQHASAEGLEARWTEVRARLSLEGWIGPFGRDARV